jgi:hypothetical protein
LTSAAKRHFTVEDRVRAAEGGECREDTGVIDEARRPTRISTR